MHRRERARQLKLLEKTAQQVRATAAEGMHGGMQVVLSLLLAALSAADETIPARGGRYVARVAERSLRVERVDADGAPDGLLFGAELPPAQPGDVQLLADDGRAFVRVHLAYSESRPVVHLWRAGRRIELTGSDFGLRHADLVRAEDGTAWLADAPGTPGIGWLDTRDGPRLFLTLACLDGEVRLVDLDDGALRRSAELARREELAVVPAGPDPGPRPARPLVTSVSAPRVILAGDPLPIEVHGEPSQAAQLEAPEGGPLQLRLALFGELPNTSPRTLELRGLPEGAHRVRVSGREEQPLPLLEVDVVPRATLLRLRTRGGIANIDEEVLVTTDGARRVRRAPDGLDLRAPVDERDLRELARLVRRLPAEAPTRAGPVDGFQHELLYRDARGEWRRMELSFTPERGPLGDLIRSARDF
jgi:hypothetical protein